MPEEAAPPVPGVHLALGGGDGARTPAPQGPGHARRHHGPGGHTRVLQVHQRQLHPHLPLHEAVTVYLTSRLGNFTKSSVSVPVSVNCVFCDIVSVSVNRSLFIFCGIVSVIIQKS